MPGHDSEAARAVWVFDNPRDCLEPALPQLCLNRFRRAAAFADFVWNLRLNQRRDFLRRVFCERYVEVPLVVNRKRFDAAERGVRAEPEIGGVERIVGKAILIVPANQRIERGVVGGRVEHERVVECSRCSRPWR